MGRKKQNKEKESKEEEEEENDENTIEEEEILKNMENVRQTEIIWETKRKMIDYVQDNDIDLCDYLDMNKLMLFIGDVCF